MLMTKAQHKAEIGILNSRIDVLRYRVQNYRTQLDKAREQLIRQNEEREKMISQFTDFRMSVPENQLFEVARMDTGQFYKCPGFPDYDTAVTKAKELAKEFIGVKFMVIGPMAVFEADVPVVSEQLSAPIKKEDEKPSDLLCG